MAKNYFRYSAAGMDGLRNSEGVQKDLLRRANEVRSSAMQRTSGLAYDVDVQPGQHRAHARCTTANERAYWVQLQTKNLTSATDAAAG